MSDEFIKEMRRISLETLKAGASETEQAIAALVVEACKKWPDFQFEIYRRTDYTGAAITVSIGVEKKAPPIPARVNVWRHEAANIIAEAIRETAHASEAWSYLTAGELAAERLRFPQRLAEYERDRK